jgi:hypothetical protein
MIDPLDIEKSVSPITANDLLCLGCSYTYGVGVAADQRYTYLMSQLLQKNEINLAQGGGSNYRSFDIFGQLDIQEGTIVILQLTELARIRWYDDKMHDIMLSTEPNRHLLYTYNDKFCIYDTIRQLRIIVNYCRVKKLKLIVWSIARFNNEFLDDVMEHYLKKFPEYVYMDNSLDGTNTYRVDNGDDGNEVLGTGHPGPKSHKIITEQLMTHFKKLYMSDKHSEVS